jgi:peptide/nickel transport system substrate-binding protein
MLSLLFQTVTQPARQKVQALVKQACARAGIVSELRAVVGSVFSASDPGNPDAESHFYTDLQLSSSILRHPDPQAFMRQFRSWEVAQKATQWTGANVTRWRDEAYDGLWRAAEREMDPVTRAALFIRMHDLVVNNVVGIPIVTRAGALAIANTLRGFDFSPYSEPLWRLAYWHRNA